MASSRMPTLLGRPTSINVRKVLWLAAELNLAIDHDASWGTGAERSTQDPAFLRLNPNGLVPVLIDEVPDDDRDDDRLVLWESNTICRYLAARQGRDDLLPTHPTARARVEQWMDWQATELNTAWRTVFMARVRRSAAFMHDEAAIRASIAAWHRLMRLLDVQLASTGAYVTGPAFTLADVVLGLSTVRWRMTPMDDAADEPRPALPAVDAWFARLQGRAGFQAFGDNGVP
jgi:glutathione S-transferase